MRALKYYDGEDIDDLARQVELMEAFFKSKNCHTCKHSRYSRIGALSCGNPDNEWCVNLDHWEAKYESRKS